MVPLSITLSDLWPGFQGHDIFWSRISEKRRVWKTKLLLHKRKLYLTYGMVLFGDLDWPLNASRGFVSISWASCFVSNSRRRIGVNSNVQPASVWSWPFIFLLANGEFFHQTKFLITFRSELLTARRVGQMDRQKSSRKEGRMAAFCSTALRREGRRITRNITISTAGALKNKTDEWSKKWEQIKTYNLRKITNKNNKYTSIMMN